MESLKYVHNFPQNHLRVLRRTDLRKCPKTYLPARVHRDIPKHPKTENITISLYCQQKSLETRPKQSLPMRPFGGPLEIPWGPNGALIQREMQTLFSSVQFSSVQLFNCSIEIAFLWFSHAFLGRFSETWKMQALFSCSLVRLRLIFSGFHMVFLGDSQKPGKCKPCSVQFSCSIKIVFLWFSYG